MVENSLNPSKAKLGYCIAVLGLIIAFYLVTSGQNENDDLLDDDEVSEVVVVTEAAYEGDLGLLGGHFDVDIYSDLNRTHHSHEYDDKHDVTFVDLISGEGISGQWASLIEPYNEVKISFVNTHNGSGTYTINSDSSSWSGNTRDNDLGTIILDPHSLSVFRLNFTSLAELRGSKPGKVENDNVHRDDAMCVNITDMSDKLIYQFSVYAHVQ